MRKIACGIVAAAAAAALAVPAATASPSGASTRTVAGTAGTVHVSFGVNRFVRSGKRLVARGSVVATYTPPVGKPTTVRKPFRARVATGTRLLGSAATTCKILYLELDKLSLNLLGLDVVLDKVILTIDANSDGGALGSLFCSLAHAKVNVRKLSTAARRLSSAARRNGLGSALGFEVPMRQGVTAQTGPCKVLDLVLGPLDLKLLGLIVHLNQVHLTITATPGAALGDLFCSLANTSSTTTTSTTTTTTPSP